MQAIRHIKTTRLAVVRGVGDVGSAIMWKLFHAGYRVLAHENRQPRTIRRKMAFCDALWNGHARLEGLNARCLVQLEEVQTFLESHNKEVGVYMGSFEGLIETVRPDVIVDGRIQKFSTVETLLGRAPLTIGVGPNFIASHHVDLVVESCWGDNLGDVIEQGTACNPVAQPPELNGFGWERFVRSDKEGCFETDKDIGDYVEKGHAVGQLGHEDVLAPLSGHIRGLLRSGLTVHVGEKICEIDPRKDSPKYKGLAERPLIIGEGVVRAVEAKCLLVSKVS